MALEKAWKTQGIFFSYFVATLKISLSHRAVKCHNHDIPQQCRTQVD